MSTKRHSLKIISAYVGIEDAYMEPDANGDWVSYEIFRAQAQTADSLADALRGLITALESLDDADAAISNEEGPTDEQQDEVLDCVAQVEYHKGKARTALAEYDKTKGQG